ncbi:MAG: hypothetical protein ABNH00_03205 [Dokdonia sp.]|jgi:hypothetical protein
MGTKKDIGKIFQEKFKDFEQAPDAGTWDTIANELDGNGKGRYPLLLWITTAVVFIGLMGLLIWQPWQSDTVSPSLVSDPELQTPSSEITTKKDAITTTTQKDAQENINNRTTTEDTATSNTTPSRLSDNANTLTDTTEVTNQKSQQTASTQTSGNTVSYSNSISEKSSATNTLKATSSNLGSASKGNTKINTVRANAGIINIDETTIAQMTVREQNARKAYRAKIAAERKAMRDQIESDKMLALAKRDSLQKAEEKAMAIAQAKKEAEKEAEKQSRNKRDTPKTEAERAEDRKEAVTYNFSVSTYTSLLSYGSLVKGSSIDDRLVDNPREAIATQGYGVRLEYVLNERSGFRFGIGVAPLKYRTNNFQVLNNGGTINVYQFSGLTPTQLEQGGTPTNPQAVAFFNDYDVVTIEQNISYIELPMDYQYKLINKRVGLSLNPGLSIFILTDNSVFAIANDNTRLRIGRETSLNDLSFAFNLGLGGFYNFAKNWRLDVEPTFRYQLNPYSNNLGNFRPYYIGVQFGATFKF